jgi:hypothetical protein
MAAFNVCKPAPAWTSTTVCRDPISRTISSVRAISTSTSRSAICACAKPFLGTVDVTGAGLQPGKDVPAGIICQGFAAKAGRIVGELDRTPA